MKVLVLGCGPAGLLAVHAASMMGNDVICVSKARKSQMYGAQYLHAPIPIPGHVDPFPSFDVRYELRGDVSAYRTKVYGEDYDGTVSPEDLTSSHRGWDIRATYDWLWETYGEYVFNEPDLADSQSRVPRVLDWARADVMISTVPAPVICRDKTHRFRSQKIWSTGQDTVADFPTIPDNAVLCNGEPYPAYYRMAKIQGHLTVEWPHNRKPPIPNLHEVEKPLDTTCNCFPQMIRMGRYGRWQKGVLSDSAFSETAALLSQPEQMRLDLDE